MDNGNDDTTLNFCHTLNSIDGTANSNWGVDFWTIPQARVAVHTTAICTSICTAERTSHQHDDQPWYAFMGLELDVIWFKYYVVMV